MTITNFVPQDCLDCVKQVAQTKYFAENLWQKKTYRTGKFVLFSEVQNTE